MNPRLQSLVDRARAIDLTPRQKRMFTWVGYPLFGLVVALIAFYVSIPQDRIKDRLETALSADVNSGQPMAIGMDVSIGELVPTLFTGVGFKASNIILRSRPLNPSEKPARYIIDDVRVRVGLMSTIFGTPTYSFKAHALSGVVKGTLSGNNDGTKDAIDVQQLVLGAAPGLQQALGGIPIDGTVSGKLAITVPKNLLANANGTLDLDVENASVGDGKAKLTVPNDPFLAAGITMPRIRLGHLTGQIVIDKGRARFENVRVHSADVDVTLEGYAELHDPIGSSQMHAYLKFRPSEALIKREPTIELLTNALTATARRPDGWYGVQITGPFMALFYLPSKDPPYGVTTHSEPVVASPPTPTPTAVAPRPAPVPAPVAAPPPPPPANEPPPANAANEPSRADLAHGGSAAEAARAASENERVAGEAAHALEGGHDGQAPRDIPPPANLPPNGGANIGAPPALRGHDAEAHPAESGQPVTPRRLARPFRRR